MYISSCITVFLFGCLFGILFGILVAEIEIRYNLKLIK